MKIRPATVGDAEELLRYLEGLMTERLRTIYQRDRLPTIEEERRFVEEANRAGILLVAEDGGIVGTMNVAIHAQPQRSHGCRFGISVKSEYRNRGIGTALIRHAIAWATHRGLRRIECDAFDCENSAIQLYRRLGFVEEGRRKGAVRIGDHFCDLVELAHTLPRD